MIMHELDESSEREHLADSDPKCIDLYQWLLPDSVL